MGRKILAVVVALIAAFAIMMVIQMLNSMVVQPPSADVMGDPAKLKEFMAGLPGTAYLVVLISYLLAAFAGGFIVTKMARQVSTGPTLAVIIGAILTFGGILNFFVMLPGQPVWFIAASLVSYIPVALFGYRLAK